MHPKVDDLDGPASTRMILSGHARCNGERLASCELGLRLKHLLVQVAFEAAVRSANRCASINSETVDDNHEIRN